MSALAPLLSSALFPPKTPTAETVTGGRLNGGQREAQAAFFRQALQSADPSGGPIPTIVADPGPVQTRPAATAAPAELPRPGRLLDIKV